MNGAALKMKLQILITTLTFLAMKPVWAVNAPGHMADDKKPVTLENPTKDLLPFKSFLDRCSDKKMEELTIRMINSNSLVKVDGKKNPTTFRKHALALAKEMAAPRETAQLTEKDIVFTEFSDPFYGFEPPERVTAFSYPYRIDFRIPSGSSFHIEVSTPEYEVVQVPSMYEEYRGNAEDDHDASEFAGIFIRSGVKKALPRNADLLCLPHLTGSDAMDSDLSAAPVTNFMKKTSLRGKR
jgi:hypothetical protein